MIRLKSFFFCLVLAAPLAGAQPTPANSPKATQTEREKVYLVQPGITAPKLLAPALLELQKQRCKYKTKSDVQLKFLVDKAGRPNYITFLHPAGNDLDRFALEVLSSDRFTPAMKDGDPVVVATAMEIELLGCAEIKALPRSSLSSPPLQLGAQPNQRFLPLEEAPEYTAFYAEDLLASPIPASVDHSTKIGGSISEPKMIFSSDPLYTDEARKKRLTGIVIVQVIVDTHGMPQNPRVIKPLGMGLDENALDAVRRYRFRPAFNQEKGTPVPVMISVSISFHLY
jgi:TonB family protein